MRARKRAQGSAISVDSDESRNARKVTIQSSRIVQLRHQQAIRHRRPVTVEKLPKLLLIDDEGLKPFETVLDPVPVPIVDCRLIVPELTLEISKHPQIGERMNVAGYHLRDGTNISDTMASRSPSKGSNTPPLASNAAANRIASSWQR